MNALTTNDMGFTRKHALHHAFAKIASYGNLALLVLSASFISKVVVNSEGRASTNSASSSACDFNLEEYTKILQNNHGISSAIKFGKKIKIVGEEDDAYCIYANFEDDLGFVVFDEENIYRRESSGTYPSALDENVCFSLCSGFLYSDPNKGGLYVPFDISANEEIAKPENNKNQVFSATNWSDVDGKISNGDIDSYMASEHPTWTFGWEYALENFVHKHQYQNSQYRKKRITDQGVEFPGNYSEGNCVPNSISSYFYNLPTVKNSLGHCFRYNEGFLSGRVTLNLSSYFASGNDVFNSQFHDNVRDANDYYSVYNGTTYLIDKEHWTTKDADDSSIASVETIYWQTRNECIMKGYLPDSGVQFDSYGEEIMESIASNLYGYSLDIVPTQVADSAVDNLINGIPVTINAIGSQTYGNHAMVVYGYRRYYKDASQTNAAYIWLVSDGSQSGQPSTRYWFDPSKCDRTTLFTTNRSTLTWPSC